MLQAGSGVIDDIGSTWDRNPSLDWRTVDRTLRGIARRRAALDALEARWLYEAERLQIWRPLGMVSAIDYLERVLGYTPHVAKTERATMPIHGKAWLDVIPRREPGVRPMVNHARTWDAGSLAWVLVRPDTRSSPWPLSS